MGMLQSGLNHLLGLGVGEALTNFATANAFLAVGGGAGGTTAYANSQTDLQGASKLRKAVTSCTRATNVVTAIATFTTADANFTWDEFGIANASSAGVMLNRGVSAAFFVKNASIAATLTVTHTVTAG
jgi:hypothetical protein